MGEIIPIPVTLYHWIFFNIIIFTLLLADLLYYYFRPHEPSIKEALLTSTAWISLALAFNVWIYVQFGHEPGLAFLTGYLLEESLSVDNLFIFLLIFSQLHIAPQDKHTVLFYGVLGAIVMRALLIWGGIAIVERFHWVFYIFGAFLIFTGIKLAFKKEEKQVEYEKHFFYRFLARIMPMTHVYHPGAFVICKDGRYMGTPLLVSLLLIETTDLIFALDSVPAILGITTDPFIVYTSNIFAILGLRSLFFVLEHVMQYFYLLHYALAVILTFIGFKMLIAHWYHIPVTWTLGFLFVALSSAMIGSYLWPQKDLEFK